MASATGMIRGTMQGSCLPPTAISTNARGYHRSAGSCAMDGVGFTATGHDVLPGGDAPEDAARMVARKPVLCHGWSLFSAPEPARDGKPVADLDAFHRTDPHHGAGDRGVEFPEDRVAQPRGAALCHDLGNPAHGIAARLSRQGSRLLDRGWRRLAVDREDPAADGDPAEGQVFQRKGAGSNPADGLPSRAPAPAPVVADAVLFRRT